MRVLLRWLLISLALFSTAAPAEELAYMRLAFWNLDGLGQSRKNTRDYAGIAMVMNRFDIIAIHGLTTIKDLDALIDVLNSTGTSKWSRLGGGDGPQAAPSVVWRSERISYDGFVRATPLTAKSEAAIHPLLVSRMRFGTKRFYLALIDIDDKAKPDAPLTLAERHINSLVRHSGGLPLFLGVSLEDSIKDSFLEKYLHYCRLAMELQSTSVLSKKRLDAVLTTYPRPVKAGVLPFHKLMGLTPKEAEATISGRLPLFVLTSLAE